MILLLYSISAQPTMYYPLMYIILAIFAFTSLPKAKRELDNEKTENFNIR